ncbi:MAG: hypothetical protein DWQ01_03135 [Planctomycetota bacterium]|nr:MAG: hypothetical protein DWQ01_03135 [Planctomycetota bacterium]
MSGEQSLGFWFSLSAWLQGLLWFLIAWVGWLGGFDFGFFQAHEGWKLLAGAFVLQAFRLRGGPAWSPSLLSFGLWLWILALGVWDFLGPRWQFPFPGTSYGGFAASLGLFAWLMDAGAVGGPLALPVQAVRRSFRIVFPILVCVLVAIGVWTGENWRSYQRQTQATEPPVGQGPSPGRASSKLLFVGLDGAHWEVAKPLVDAGLMPNLASLMARGHSGALESHRSYRPTKDRWGWWSAVVWTSIATGLGESKHGILDFQMREDESGPWKSPNLVLTHRGHWQARPFWEIFAEYGIRCSVFGWWNTAPVVPFEGELVTLDIGRQNGCDALAAVIDRCAENPETAAAWMHPPELMQHYRSKVRIPSGQEEVDAFLRQELLDLDRNAGTEEAAEEIFRRIVHQDWYFKELSRVALLEDRSRLVVFYCEGTDSVQHHYYQYRADSLEGARLMYERGEEPERLRDMVDNYYRLADRWLGELLEAAGPEWNIMVVSDHGHRHTYENSKRLSDHKGGGLYVVAGPDFQQGSWPEPAIWQNWGLMPKEPSILDLAPTMHYLFGVPLAEDMDGKVQTAWLKPELVQSLALYQVPTYRQQALDLPLEALQANREEMNAFLNEMGYTDAEDDEEPENGGGE